MTALGLSMILGFASTSKTPLESSKSWIAWLQRPRMETGGEMVTCLGKITAAWVRDVVGGDKPKKDVAVYKFFLFCSVHLSAWPSSFSVCEL